MCTNALIFKARMMSVQAEEQLRCLQSRPLCAGVRKQDRKPPSPAHARGRAAGADGRATRTPRHSPAQAGGTSPCPSCASCLNWAPHRQARGPSFHSEPFLSGPLPGGSAFLPQVAGFFSNMDQSQDKLKKIFSPGQHCPQ